jgi:hypothetical protein
MDVTRICLLLAALLSGCAQDSGPLEPISRRPEDVEQITYHDRNGDGKADLEKHHHPGWADADWELRDDNFDGRFEKKILYGVGVFETAVDLPVPASVRIEKKL